MKNNFKKAITLAEIMIVIVIIAIVALVFLAMPRKNIGKMDRAKYYIAYNTLKRMQEEQMAQTGRVAINHDDCHSDGQGGYTCPNCTKKMCTNAIRGSTNINTNEDFGRATTIWLNVVNPPAGTGRIQGQNITLTNGMVIRIPNTDAFNCPGAVAGADGRIPQCLDVTIDIDGVDNNGNVCSGGDGIDCHTFTLGSDGVVTPVFTDDSNSEDWIRFKVYHIDDNGDKIVDDTNIKYECAVRYICCKNDISRRECTSSNVSTENCRPYLESTFQKP